MVSRSLVLLLLASLAAASPIDPPGGAARSNLARQNKFEDDKEAFCGKNFDLSTLDGVSKAWKDTEAGYDLDRWLEKDFKGTIPFCLFLSLLFWPLAPAYMPFESWSQC
jgi:hypothetical protein